MSERVLENASFQKSCLSPLLSLQIASMFPSEREREKEEGRGSKVCSFSSPALPFGKCYLDLLCIEGKGKEGEGGTERE